MRGLTEQGTVFASQNGETGLEHSGCTPRVRQVTGGAGPPDLPLATVSRVNERTNRDDCDTQVAEDEHGYQ